MSPNTGRQPKRISSKCKICGVPALYQYFGAVVCHPCKAFFKRNAETGMKILKCHFDGHCEINVSNRHICKYCRLEKCFANGMAVDLIRNSRLPKPIRPDHSPMISIINILTFDKSDLNFDQSKLIMNLTQYYEEHNVVSCIQNFMDEQSRLPVKLRLKISSICELFVSILSKIELFFQSNQDFVSVSLHDRSILLRSAMKNAGSLISVLILQKIQLYDQPSFSQSPEITKDLSTQLLENVNHHTTFIKLGYAMVAFSTTNSTNYSNTGLTYLENLPSILRIQDMYVEVAWKYLRRKYNYAQTVMCFTNFIKIILIIISVTEDYHCEHYNRMMINLIEKINQQVPMNK